MMDFLQYFLIPFMAYLFGVAFGAMIFYKAPVKEPEWEVLALCKNGPPRSIGPKPFIKACFTELAVALCGEPEEGADGRFPYEKAADCMGRLRHERSRWAKEAGTWKRCYRDEAAENEYKSISLRNAQEQTKRFQEEYADAKRETAALAEQLSECRDNLHTANAALEDAEAVIAELKEGLAAQPLAYPSTPTPGVAFPIIATFTS